MTSEQRTPQGGGDAPVNRTALEAFLKTAPPELDEWAADQLRLLGEMPQAGLLEEGAPEQSAPGYPEPDDGDEPDDFYDDMEGDDDILQRVKASPGKPGAASGAKKAPLLSPALRGVLVIALIVGVAVGIWFAGQSGDDPDPVSPSITADQGADPAVRIGELEEAVDDDPNDIESRLQLGVQYFNLGMIESAREQWDAVIELDENQVTAWYNLGFYHLSSSPADMEAAEDAWQRVIELEPESEMAATIAMHLQGLAMTDESEE